MMNFGVFSPASPRDLLVRHRARVRSVARPSPKIGRNKPQRHMVAPQILVHSGTTQSKIARDPARNLEESFAVYWCTLASSIHVLDAGGTV